MYSRVVEWAAFTLKEGASEDALLRASDQLQKDFIAVQPGFIRRELMKGAKGEFVDVLWWESMELAEAAMARAGESPICAVYFGLMNEGADAADVKHFREVKAY